MYYNKVTFPIYLFKLSFEGSTVEEVFSNIFFLLEQKSFEQDFVNNLKGKSMQDLFAYLTTVLPPIMLTSNEYKNNLIVDLPLSNFKNDRFFLDLLKIRFDIKGLSSILTEMETDHRCIKLNRDDLIKDLINFVYQYVFVELSKNIVATEMNEKQYYFDFKRDIAKVEKYKQTNSTRADLISSQTQFIKNYYQSFDTKDESVIELIEYEIDSMYTSFKQKKKLHSIFETHFILHEKISSKEKYMFFKYLFVSFTAKLFFTHLKVNDFEDDDIEIEGCYNNFIRSVTS